MLHLSRCQAQKCGAQQAARIKPYGGRRRLISQPKELAEVTLK